MDPKPVEQIKESAKLPTPMEVDGIALLHLRGFQAAWYDFLEDQSQRLKKLVDDIAGPFTSIKITNDPALDNEVRTRLELNGRCKFLVRPHEEGLECLFALHDHLNTKSIRFTPSKKEIKVSGDGMYKSVHLDDYITMDYMRYETDEILKQMGFLHDEKSSAYDLDVGTLFISEDAAIMSCSQERSIFCELQSSHLPTLRLSIPPIHGFGDSTFFGRTYTVKNLDEIPEYERIDYEKVLSSIIRDVLPLLEPRTLVSFDKALKSLPPLDSSLAITDGMTLESFFESIQPRK